MNRRAVAALLAPHAGHPLQLVDDVSLRCTSCAVVLLLDSGRATWLPADQLRHVELTEDARCAAHPGQLRRSCGGCRADRLAAL